MATKKKEPVEPDVDDTETDPEGDENARKHKDAQARIRDLSRQKREAEARADQLESTIEEMRGQVEGSAALAEQLAAAKAELAEKTATWEAESAWRDAGLNDPEARDLANYLYGKLPEKDRPARADVAKGWRDDPSKAPRAMQGYLGDSAKGAQGKGEGKSESGAKSQETKSTPAARPATPPPRAGNGGAPKSPTGAPVDSGADAEAIKAAKEKGQQTGDWSDFKALSGPQAAKTPAAPKAEPAPEA